MSIKYHNNMQPTVNISDEKVIEELWYKRYPAHDINADSGRDMFFGTVLCVFNEFAEFKGYTDKWINAKDIKPTREDADENGYIECAFWNNGEMKYYRGTAIWFTIASGESDLTMWRKTIPLPIKK